MKNKNSITNISEENEVQFLNINDFSNEMLNSLEVPKALDSSVHIISNKRQKIDNKKTDRALVKDFLNNPTHENFNSLFERFYYGLKKYAYNIVKDFDCASDMVITTFEIAWDKWKTYDPNKAEFSTWLYTICRNNCLLYKKERKKANIIDQDINDCYDIVIANGNTTNGGATISTNIDAFINPNDDFIVDGNKDIEMIDKYDVMEKMCDASVNEIKNIKDKKTVTILEEKLLNNKKIKEIAVQLNENESNIKNRLYAGKRELSQILQSKYADLYDLYREMWKDEGEDLILSAY